MKFTCDRCDAQYMISDEKVGPNGVKVRCKKCQNVILVRRAPENGAVAPEAPAAAPRPEGGLDAELGSAFDHAFGDTPAGGTPVARPDLDATQAMSSEEAARVAGPAPADAPPASEWYVAIGQAQVGPLPLLEVKRKWEAGDVGPDSLVWRPGMGDWAPLTSVQDLAAYLAPVPRAAAARASRTPVPGPAPGVARAEPGAAAASGGAAGVPAADVTWKPVGASALAALASEEIATRNAPEPRAEARKPFANGVKSLVEELPDGGGVDPTGAIPLPMKALEKSGEHQIERRSAVARGAEEIRQRRSTTRLVVIGVAAVVLVVGGAAAGAVWWLDQKLPAAPAVASAPAPEPTPAPAAPAAAAVPPGAVAQSAPPAAPVAAEPAAAVPAKAEAPPPAPAAEPVQAAPLPSKVARAEPPAPQAKRESPARREPTRVAQATPPPAPPAPEPAPRKKKDLLDFDSNDSALDEALGSGKPSGRSVYVPPAPGGTSLAATVTDSQVNETILGKVSSLQTCMQQQKAKDPEVSGTLRMRWRIAPDGSVSDVKCLTPEHASSPFAQCLTGAFKGMRFPKSANGRQDVTFPIKF
jgi:predicted Zn finger-like uncharacterized protein